MSSEPASARQAMTLLDEKVVLLHILVCILAYIQYIVVGGKVSVFKPTENEKTKRCSSVLSAQRLALVSSLTQYRSWQLRGMPALAAKAQSSREN